jgi:hypothetical protein
MGKLKESLIDTQGFHWPQNYETYEYDYELGQLLCFLDYSAPDKSVGYNGSAWLVHAYAGGVDVIDLLKDTIIKEIEALACSSLSRR